MDDISIISGSATMSITPHWVALEKGFFKEEEINVSMELFPGKPRGEAISLPQFRDKLVFKAPGSPQPQNGEEFVNFICTQDRPPHVIIARPEIQSITDLKGKRIIVGMGSRLDGIVVLQRFGLDPNKDVVWVSDIERVRVEKIKRGEVNATISGAPHWAMGVKMGLRRLPSARDFEIQPHSGLSTYPHIIQERPDLIKRIVRALIKGTEFARLNKEETLDITQRHITYTDRDTLSYCYDSIHDQWYIPANEEPYIEMAELMEREYKLPHKPWNSYFNLTFVRQAMQVLRLYRNVPKALEKQ